MLSIGMKMGGYKWTHVSESSDSYKENLMIVEENQLAIINATPNLGGWQKVEKKKGRKG